MNKSPRSRVKSEKLLTAPNLSWREPDKLKVKRATALALKREKIFFEWLEDQLKTSPSFLKRIIARPNGAALADRLNGFPNRRIQDLAKRVFEKFYLGASRLSMRRMAARSMRASEVWTFNS